MKFAFEKLDHLIEWIGDKETYLNILKDSSGFYIKEINIPENMIITYKIFINKKAL